MRVDIDRPFEAVQKEVGNNFLFLNIENTGKVYQDIRFLIKVTDINKSILLLFHHLTNNILRRLKKYER